MVQKKRKSRNEPSNTFAVDNFNSMLSMFQGEEEEVEVDNMDLSENVEEEKVVEEEETKPVEKKLKRKHLKQMESLNKPLVSEKSEKVEQKEVPEISGNNTEELVELKKKLEDRELDLKIKERELKKKEKEMKDLEKDILKSKAQHKALMELNRNSTVSVAIPSNILDDIDSQEMKLYIIEMIARLLILHAVDEVIVYDITSDDMDDDQNNNKILLLKILEFIETPKYLREHCFDMENDQDYQYCHKLNKIDSTQMNKTKKTRNYREGIVSEKLHQQKFSLVNIGLEKLAVVDRRLKSGTRVTVEILDNQDHENHNLINGKIISTMDIKKEGYYWGYQIRSAENVDGAISDSPYKKSKSDSTSATESAYDYRVLLSSDGVDSNSLFNVKSSFKMKPYDHLLILFAPINGASQNNISETNFRYHINTHTSYNDHLQLRFEEDILLSLSKLKGILF
ncbi:DUF171 family protein [Tieghemostelium lacteum]|uniref:DUF171 family protein n=1 Tax=Tieghemostelium lacteum TaxID=361077 RepID=A0A152A3D7_TIELA|nr:DUF171 family protein [Tieghemostelium lacteum]|eukprot:KYR00561.1 DUF171 family protein [Tieghemostelium lacteum]